MRSLRSAHHFEGKSSRNCPEKYVEEKKTKTEDRQIPPTKKTKEESENKIQGLNAF